MEHDSYPPPWQHAAPALSDRFTRIELMLENTASTLEAARPDPTLGAKRRTFAIISHPDAGKTTLTERLLLFGGAIQAARNVRAPRHNPPPPPDSLAISPAP